MGGIVEVTLMRTIVSATAIRPNSRAKKSMTMPTMTAPAVPPLIIPSPLMIPL